MRSSFGNPDVFRNEIQATFSPSKRDKIVGPSQFGNVCRLLWPIKTAAHIAAIAKRDVRTAERWIDGEHEPPIIVLVAIINRMFER